MRNARLGQLVTTALSLAAVLLSAGCVTVQREEALSTPAMRYAWGSTNLDRQEFVKYLNTLDFTVGKSNVKARRCKQTGNECRNAADRTRVEISPEAQAKELDPERLDANGHVIAVLRNYGNADEARYDIPANADVYWLVRSTPSGTAESLFIWFERGSPQHRGPFPYAPCEDGMTHPNSGLETDFKPCPNARDANDGSRDDGEEPTQGVDASPAWISCLAGCCVAGSASETSQATHVHSGERVAPER